MSIIHTSIPVGSVADYYGFPTQKAIPLEVLKSCHDLKFRGYLEIYNNYFRDQNYQPPIPYSKLNVYNGFLDEVEGHGPPVAFGPRNNQLGEEGLDGYVQGYFSSGSPEYPSGLEVKVDGSYGEGAIGKELYGSELAHFDDGVQFSVAPRYLPWRAYNRPLKANKLHDYFTSVLPSPQKGQEALIPLTGGVAPVVADRQVHSTEGGIKLWDGYDIPPNSMKKVYSDGLGTLVVDGSESVTLNNIRDLKYTNMVANLEGSGVSVSVSDLRTAAAVQQVYEILGRSGSRYTEYINAFFGLDTENPFLDIPTCIGHIRRDLELYQTAQTSQTTSTSAQGDLAAFGYTSTGGHLFTRTFLEHGYIHVMAVVRQKNIYPSFMSRDNFRRSFMDFYQYPLANISEQPVYTREINPFAGNNQVFGYQEAWAEYRVEPDRVSGLMRPGVPLSLSQWTLADDFDANLLIADGDFMQSNAEEVTARGVAVVDDYAPQFKGKFTFKITKQRPLPTYSVTGMDII